MNVVKGSKMSKLGKLLNENFKEEHQKTDSVSKAEQIKERRIYILGENGSRFVTHEKMSQWMNCVRINVTLNREKDLDVAIKIMDGLNRGMSFDRLKKVLYQQEKDSGISLAMVKNIVKTFHKYGEAFCKSLEAKTNKQNNEKQM